MGGGRGGGQRKETTQRTRQRMSQVAASRLHPPSLGICEAALASVTHSNAEHHDNRLTDDWSGCRTLARDLTAVCEGAHCVSIFAARAGAGVLFCSVYPVNETKPFGGIEPAAEPEMFPRGGHRARS